MIRPLLLTTALLAASTLPLACGARADDTTVKISKPDHPVPHLENDEAGSDGSVDTGGQHGDYHAVAGTLVVHPRGWDDAAKTGTDADKSTDDSNPTAEASMFYVAYFRKNVRAENRPITFLYNGGPGSASVWLHMGALGPRRVVTLDHSHGPAAPYQLINNDQSLMDASDLVFVDAPGTGFSRIAGKDKEKNFFGVDQDGYAFDQFITTFLSKYGRWNSPKYLFGESYGTTRSAVLANELEQDNVDLNGVILLSQILNFDLSVDGPQANPGIDEAYIAALPTYAATAWYHHKLPGNAPTDLPSFLTEVENYASTDYAAALQQGALLDHDHLEAVARKLNQYTGLPVAYLEKADLRVDGGMFEHTLLSDGASNTGRFDTRFAGPSMDPLAKEAEYDPQSAAISSAYVSAFNDYVRRQLGYGGTRAYKAEIQIDSWDMKHQQPNTTQQATGSLNVMPDLAAAMVYNPNLKVQLNQGYYDLATPYFGGEYEMRHLPMPHALQANIEFRHYESGHMVYAHQDSLKQLHDNVADFIRRTQTGGGPTKQPAPAKQPG